ncbi:MAG: hypothetical protein F9K49_00020 [Caedimonadaceae bacterium]|jgi:hypothetical protein|nr:MAG: hypothetical protein F9K49_00020 [Caedimonadaceae bacterium]
MRKVLYQRIVTIINECGTWMEVADANHLVEFSMLVDGQFRKSLCPAILLRNYRSKWQYEKGHTWAITEYDMDKAIARMKAQDPSFRKRFSECRISYQDVERIIEKASFGIIKLELFDYESNYM